MRLKFIKFKKYLVVGCGLILLLFNSYGFSYDDDQDDSATINIGAVANNMSDLLGGVVELVLTVTTIAGIVFCCAALAKLYQHKKNPQQVPISQFFIILILGLVLLGLPFVLEFGKSAHNLF